MAPIDINNQEISSITLNGNTEINTVEVNGQEVFSAQTLPVAYSNLVAWYPFDSATYGGSNADDVTAILGGSGDDTAYDGTVNGATYQSSGGVTDISAGANSGAFDFTPNEDIQTNLSTDGFSQISFMCWVEADNLNSTRPLGSWNGRGWELQLDSSEGWETFLYTNNGEASVKDFTNFDGDYHHLCASYNGSTLRLFIDGSEVGSTSQSGNVNETTNVNIGVAGSLNKRNFNGRIDDVRIYNTSLSSNQINQIYQNTQP